MKALAALTVLSVCAVSGAQEPNMAELMKMGEPGPMHKVLGQMEGKWDVTITFKMGDMPEQTSTATCEAKWLFGGRVLFKEYKSEMMGQPFIVHQYNGYDNMNKFAWEFQIESNNTAAMFNKGDISKDGKVMTLSGRYPNPMHGGKDTGFKSVATFNGADSYTIEWFDLLEKGVEQRTVKLVHTRKK
jgi:hypothetical protein